MARISFGNPIILLLSMFSKQQREHWRRLDENSKVFGVARETHVVCDIPLLNLRIVKTYESRLPPKGEQS